MPLLDIPKITQTVRLSDYADELAHLPEVRVWVNPPKTVLDAYNDLFARKQKADAAVADAKPEEAEALKAAIAEMAKVGDGFADWYAQIWSQGGDPAGHWTADEVRQLATLDTDPALYQWLTRRTWDAINAHRAATRKN